MELLVGKRCIPPTFFVIISIFLSFSLSRAASASLEGSSNIWCNGTTAECLAGGSEAAEFLMDSDISRRLLAQGDRPTTQSLNPAALCDRVRYHNCLPDKNGDVKVDRCKTYNRCRQGIE